MRLRLTDIGGATRRRASAMVLCAMLAWLVALATPVLAAETSAGAGGTAPAAGGDMRSAGWLGNVTMRLEDEAMSDVSMLPDTPAALERGRVWRVAPPLDVAAMREGARHLVGHHDFTTFRDRLCQAKSPLKTLDALEVSRRGDEIRIEARARSFLHRQMRNMAGTLELVGIGRWQPDDVATALAARDRRAAYRTRRGIGTASRCGSPPLK